MYNEGSERVFSVRSFILKIILVVLFVFLLMWLLPMPNLKPVYDRIFADNVDTMRDAAKSYFTVERLPKDVNKSVRLTLNEMLSMKLLLPLADSNNKLCDGNSSYVEIMKTNTEYLIKVNLSCPNKSGYIVEHLGCYDICSDKCVPTEVKEVVLKPTNNKPKQPKPPVNPPKPPVDPPKPPVDPPKPPVVVNYEYEYAKPITTPSSYWSDWSNPIKIKVGETINYGYNSSYTVNNEALPAQKEVVGYNVSWETTASSLKTRSLVYTVGSYSVKACKEYQYTKYATTGTTYRYEWKNLGTQPFNDLPSDTLDTKYINIKPQYDKCSSACTSGIYYTATVYHREKVSVSSAQSGTIDTNCVAYEDKPVTVENTITQQVLVPTEVKKITQPIYAMINYYHQKTLQSSSTTTYIYSWSKSNNDTTLINQNYRLTGNKKEVK